MDTVEHFVGDDSIDWSRHWLEENPPDRKDFEDPNAFDYAIPFIRYRYNVGYFTVLEVGCGIGVWATNWKMIGGTYSGVDASFHAFDIARRRHPELMFYLGEAQEMDLGTKFDVIFTHTFLQHTSLKSKRQILPRLANHLADDGLLIIQENTNDGNTATTFTRAGWIAFISRYGFRCVKTTEEGDNRNGFVFVKTL